MVSPSEKRRYDHCLRCDSPRCHHPPIDKDRPLGYGRRPADHPFFPVPPSVTRAQKRWKALWDEYEEVNAKNDHYPSKEGDALAVRIGRATGRLERLKARLLEAAE